MFFGKKQANQNQKIILDIGTQYVKILDLYIKNKEVKLNNYKIINLVQGGKRFISKEISKRIKMSLQDMKITENRIFLSVSGKSVIVRFMDMPTMNQKELRNAIKFQTDLRFPFDLNESLFDCQILPGAKAPEGKMKVVIAAAPKKEIEKTMEVIKNAGLVCVKIDVDVVALANAFEWGRPKEEDASVALVNIGATKTHITIVENGNPIFCRELNYGGINVTEAISSAMEINFDQAEEKKLKGDSETMAVIEEAIKPISTGLAQSFDFYEGSSGVHIHKIFLSGGGAQILGIIDSLKPVLNRSVFIWNPLRSIDYASVSDKELIQSSSPLLAIGLGIGLGEIG